MLLCNRIQNQYIKKCVNNTVTPPYPHTMTPPAITPAPIREVAPHFGNHE